MSRKPRQYAWAKRIRKMLTSDSGKYYACAEEKHRALAYLDENGHRPFGEAWAANGLELGWMVWLVEALGIAPHHTDDPLNCWCTSAARLAKTVPAAQAEAALRLEVPL